MFDRFTERSRRVVVLAQEESGRLRHGYIGTEHLLLGLIREEEGVAAQALAASGVTVEGVREQVETIVGYGETDASQKPFRAEPKRVLESSLKESMRLGHNYIGTEHLLLGLIQEEDGIAARALGALGVDLDGAREQVESIVGYGEEGVGAQAPFTPRTTKVLQLALREALQLGHDYVSTEHVLLGLVRESEGVAARVLLNLDVDPDAVRREVIKRLPDAGDGLDPFDEAEWEMEEPVHRTLFRGRVDGIRAELDLPRPVAVAAGADYAYRTRAGSSPGSTSVEPGGVADLMRAGLQESDARGLEAVIAALGERLLDAFPAMLEVTVTLSGPPDPADPPGPTFSVSATFRR